MLVIDPSLLEDKIEELPLEFDDYEDEVAFKETLRGWHQDYGHIYMTEINDVAFFFRALTKGEMDIAKTVYTEDYERTEYICKACVIEPVIEDFSLEIFAGVPEILCRQILNESGFTNPDKVKIMIAKWEQKVSEVENQLPLVIKEVFTDIPVAEIEMWPMEKIAEYYVKAKWVMENLRGIELVSNEAGN